MLVQREKHLNKFIQWRIYILVYVNTVINIYSTQGCMHLSNINFWILQLICAKKFILNKGTLLAKEKPSQVSVIVRKV